MTQKRALVEDLRLRLKIAEENASSDATFLVGATADSGVVVGAGGGSRGGAKQDAPQHLSLSSRTKVRFKQGYV